MKKPLRISALLLALLFTTACQKDFLDTEPNDNFASTVMFETIEGANLALNGMYRYLYAFHPGYGWGYGNHFGYGHMAHLHDMDLMGEDMVLHSSGYGWVNQQYRWITHRNALDGVTHERWRMPYALINKANNILFYMDDVDAPSTQKNRIKAQAYAARAFAYYHLVMMYAPAYIDDPSAPGLPLYTRPEQEGHPRSSVLDVYDLIADDLAEAIALFDGVNTRPHRSHINLATAHGFAARVGLAMGEWTAARDHADAAITYHGADQLFTQEDYPDQFALIYEEDEEGEMEVVGYDFTAMSGFNNAAESSEWMWGSIIKEEHATIYASFMSNMDPRFMTYASLGQQKKITRALYDQISETDVRKNLWVPPDKSFWGYYEGYTADIPPYCQMKMLVQEIGSWAADYIYMRLSEMYLIKAEAEARGGNDAAAAQTLHDLVSTRDHTYTLSTNTGEALIEEIMLHRRIELWGEGHRWIDLKRLQKDLVRVTGAYQGNHDPGLANVIEVPAGDKRWNWLIPQDELDMNDAIGEEDQNP